VITAESISKASDAIDGLTKKQLAEKLQFFLNTQISQ
jgi:hypothetical protein